MNGDNMEQESHLQDMVNPLSENMRNGEIRLAFEIFALAMTT